MDGPWQWLHEDKIKPGLTHRSWLPLRPKFTIHPKANVAARLDELGLKFPLPAVSHPSFSGSHAACCLLHPHCRPLGGKMEGTQLEHPLLRRVNVAEVSLWTRSSKMFPLPGVNRAPPSFQVFLQLKVSFSWFFYTSLQWDVLHGNIPSPFKVFFLNRNRHVTKLKIILEILSVFRGGGNKRHS